MMEIRTLLFRFEKHNFLAHVKFINICNLLIDGFDVIYYKEFQDYTVFMHLNSLVYILDVRRWDKIGGDFQFSTVNRNAFLTGNMFLSIIVAVNRKLFFDTYSKFWNIDNEECLQSFMRMPSLTLESSDFPGSSRRERLAVDDNDSLKDGW